MAEKESANGQLIRAEADELIRRAMEHPGVAEYLQLLADVSSAAEQSNEVDSVQNGIAVPILSSSSTPNCIW